MLNNRYMKDRMALLLSKIIKNATLKVYKGAPHGLCSSLKDQINEDLLTFLKCRRSNVGVN